VLKRVLHDWDDAKSVRILRNVRQAMASHARLLVIEGVVTPDDGDSQARECDVAIMTFLNGRVRTRADFEALFATAGLKLVQVLPATPLVKILEVEPI